MQWNENLQLLEEIFKEGPIVIFVWKNELDWPVEFVSSNVEQLTGYTDKDWLEQKVVYKEIVHKDDIKRVKEEVSLFSHELKLKRWKHKPYRIIKKNGETIWVNDYTICIYDENKKPLKYIGYLIDITQQYLQQQDLENELETYFNFFEYHSAPMLIIDPETGRIINANQSACQFYGYSKNRFKQLTIYDINTLSNEEIKIRLNQAFNFKMNYFQFPHRLADGSIREVEVFSSIINLKNKKYLFSIIHDITEKIQLEKKLEKLNQELESLLQKEIKERVYIYKKFKLIFEQKFFGIGIIKDGYLIEYNPYLLELIELNENEIKQTNFWDLIEFKDNKYFLFKNFDQFNKIQFNQFYEVQLKNKTEKYFLLFIAPFIDVTYKNKIEILILLYDITEKKQIEKEKQEKEKMLLYQSKLAAIGESLSALAHQWRQPLNSLSLIIQYIQQLSELGELNKENLNETLNEAIEQIHFLSTTIDDFRNFFKADTEKTYFFVKDEFFSLLKIVQNQLENHNIKIIIEGDDFNVYGYPNLFKHAILNIINNAKDAIFDKKKEKLDFKGKIKINFDSHKKMINICDNGGGIREDILPKIFQPYVSTKKEEGTGLGLYLCYHILKKMNATIYCYNHIEENERGACFVIQFRE
ncbi:MAG: hypothetical protein KatS3mg129_0457 [Leptospiraceae bacterium]|nr:MAG: hypothetical protein KatS3mg129_0457 [Leptospiraceae bacterium]